MSATCEVKKFKAMIGFLYTIMAVGFVAMAYMAFVLYGIMGDFRGYADNMSHSMDNMAISIHKMETTIYEMGEDVETMKISMQNMGQNVYIMTEEIGQLRNSVGSINHSTRQMAKPMGWFP